MLWEENQFFKNSAIGKSVLWEDVLWEDPLYLTFVYLLSLAHFFVFYTDPLFFFQVDPRCHIQSLYWFHESPSGESRLLKTGRNATEPYIHNIESAFDHHQGRYYCRIENVMGINECSAFLIIRNSASKKSQQQISALFLLLGSLLYLLQWQLDTLDERRDPTFWISNAHIVYENLTGSKVDIHRYLLSIITLWILRYYHPAPPPARTA